MKVKPIRTKKEHKAMLKRSYELIQQDPEQGSESMDELELLALVISDYEDEHDPVLPPDPIEAIKFRLEQLGMSETDLAKMLGFRQRKSDILNRRRKLNLNMIRVLREKLNIPAETLISDYKLDLP